MFRNKRRLAIILVVALVLGGGGFFVFKNSQKANTKEQTTVKKGTVTKELVLTGEISATEYANLKFLTSGELNQIYVKEGQAVKKGQILGKLDTKTLNATYEKALSDLRSAEATVEKVHDDVKDHDSNETFTQKETRTAAEAAKDKAYEAVLIAEKNLADATLRAPFSGIVSQIKNPYGGIGVLYSEGQIEVVNPQTLYFSVMADQSEVVDLQVGQKVKLILDSYPDEEFSGEVVLVSYTPETGEAGSVYEVKVKFVDFDYDISKFRLGMTGDARFSLEEKADVLYVPPQYVNSDSSGAYVSTKKRNGKTYVDVGLEGEERVEIKGDSVSEGTVVFD